MKAKLLSPIGSSPNRLIVYEEGKWAYTFESLDIDAFVEYLKKIEEAK